LNIIEEFDFIPEELASDEARKVLALSPEFFVRRGNSFSTLGAAAYLDGLYEYFERAEKKNRVIDENFDALLRLTRNKLSKIMGREVIDLPMAARVGFHIFDSRSLGKQADWHIDETYKNVSWCEPFSMPFSFTVALALPHGDGGLNYKESFDEDAEIKYQPYRVGKLYVSSGLFPHQIANHTPATDDQPRVTLQGHGAVLSFSGKVAVYF